MCFFVCFYICMYVCLCLCCLFMYLCVCVLCVSVSVLLHYAGFITKGDATLQILKPLLFCCQAVVMVPKMAINIHLWRKYDYQLYRLSPAIGKASSIYSQKKSQRLLENIRLNKSQQCILIYFFNINVWIIMYFVVAFFLKASNSLAATNVLFCGW